ncbi:hypothetical protein ACFL6I_26825 [candidate division KSB1 bacterium]
MKILVFGRDNKNIEKLATDSGHTIVSKDPEVVFSHGGDGTLILSEFYYPGVPKLPFRSSAVCKLCSPLTNEEVSEQFNAGQYSEVSLPKLDVSAHGVTLHAVNDVIVHNFDPRHAMRYRVSVNHKQRINHGIIGDGVVVATPLGSSGYYRSITGSIFSSGIGLAFNNSTEQFDHIVLNKEDIITILITRGPARVYADNQEEFLDLAEGDSVEIKNSSQVARLIKVNPTE